MSEIHEVARAGFGAEAEAYERGRPSYPPAAVRFVVDALGIGPGRTVLDIGAGTGKFTRLLVPTGARIVAVEPVGAMREKLAALVPEAEVVEGTGEALPLPDASADAAVVAQAFHWFRADAALAEIARVLRPGGGLALVWNSRDRRVPWVARMSEIIRWNAGQIPTYDAGDERWRDLVAASGRFTPLEMRELELEHEVDVETLLDRVRSVSYIADMAEPDQAAVLGEVRALVAGFPPRFVLPYRTFVYWCQRRG
jgi:SAM-dependent methyltransferase